MVMVGMVVRQGFGSQAWAGVKLGMGDETVHGMVAEGWQESYAWHEGNMSHTHAWVETWQAAMGQNRQIGGVAWQVFVCVSGTWQ